MTDSKPTSYDQVPYESHPFSQTHPDRLATIALLLGLKPAPVERCRVLELGCAAGGNLLPMADTLPDSSFVGIDLSRVQVSEGQQISQTLGLKNIELKHLSILDVGPDFGKFHYIICHGVYSWVPSPVQDKILDICKHHLAPNGVAYVSYNTLPGWHMRGMIRDMLTYHARHFHEPAVRVKQARNLLEFLAKSVARENSPYSLMLKAELEAFHRSNDSYLYHEHLEDVNEPIYFHEFVERAAAKKLRYLAETDLRVMVPGNFPPEVENVLQMLAQDIVHIEQYMDFLRNRMFRQTLLCHDQLTPNYALRPEQLTALHIASPVKVAADKPDLTSTEPEKFESPDGVTLPSRDPLVKAAMVTLAEVWPETLPFNKLLGRARELAYTGRKTTAPEFKDDVHTLGQALLTFYASASTSLVELHSRPLRLTARVGPRPATSALARLQAASGARVTTLRHEMVLLGDLERQLLRLLDGSREQAALLPPLAELVAQGDLLVEQNGQAVQDGPQLHTLLGNTVEQQLPLLARHGLFLV